MIFSSLDLLAPIFPEWLNFKCKKNFAEATKMLKYRFKFFIFFKIKWKTVLSLLKFCKNQEFSEKKLYVASKCYLCLKKNLISIKKMSKIFSLARPYFCQPKIQRTKNRIWCGLKFKSQMYRLVLCCHRIRWVIRKSLTYFSKMFTIMKRHIFTTLG